LGTIRQAIKDERLKIIRGSKRMIWSLISQGARTTESRVAIALTILILGAGYVYLRMYRGRGRPR